MLENENNITNTEEVINEPSFDEPNQEVVEAPKKKKKEKKDKKEKSKFRKILDWVITGVFGTLIAISAGFLIYSKVGGDGFIGNYMFPQVLTDSMGDVYPVGSVLVVEKVDPADIKPGDNVTFKYDITPSNGKDDKVNMTHQIFSVEEDPDWAIGSGSHYKFVAHGTNKKSEFCKIGEEYGDCTNQYQHFRERDLVGRVVRVSPVLTGLNSFVKQPIGLIVLVLVPCMYLMVTSVLDIFKKLPDDDEVPKVATSSGDGTVEYKPKTYAPGEDPLAGMSEEDKERLKKELLDELLGKGGKKK